MQRSDALLSMAFTAHNQKHQFVGDGVMADPVWENRMRSMRRLLRLPGYRQWWTEWGDLYSDELRNLVDGLIREIEAVE